ncbi:MAG: structural cement protein Gp24 [Myxococcota bacterium]
MAVQTEYNQNPDIGMEGQLAQPAQFQDIASGKVETEDGIAPGLGVVQGTEDDQVAIADDSATIVGVSVLRVARETATWAENEVMPVLKKGYIYVRVEDAVSKHGDAFVRHTAPGSETVGAFRSDGDGGNARSFPGVFRSDAGAGELALLEVDVTALT